jgi:LPS export ABC transporter protein LptC
VKRLALVALLAASAVADACSEADTPPVAKAGSPADSADQFLVGMSVKLNDAGVQRAEIKADSAYFYNENTLLLMRAVHSQFYTSTGVQEGVLTSRAARYDTKTDLMEATGDVVLVTQDGRRLTTSQLVYDKSKNLIHSDSAFKYTTPDGEMEGIGFDSDPGMNPLKVLHGPKGKSSTLTLPKR